MQVSFEGRGDRWAGAVEIAERSETDKHQPWSLKAVSGSETVEGTMLVTDLASNRRRGASEEHRRRRERHPGAGPSPAR